MRSGARILLHDKVAERLRRHVLTHCAPGERLDSITDFARRYHTSVNTVRLALHLLAREGLVQLRHGSGSYRTGQALPPGRHIALLLDADVFSWAGPSFHGLAAQCLRVFLRDRGLASRLYVGYTQDADIPDEQKQTCPDFMADLLGGRLSGVVILAAAQITDWLPLARRQHIPVVGGSLAEEYSGHVRVDYEGMIREGIDRLAALGRRRIACLTWGAQIQRYQPGCSPVNLFRAALHAHGLPYHPEWVRSDLNPRDDGAGWAGMREVWSARPEKPDGLLVTDDVLFGDAQRALVGMGVRVPEKLALVTHVNRGAAMRGLLPVTRLIVDPADFANAAGSMLLDLIQGTAATPCDRIVPFSVQDPEDGIASETDVLETAGTEEVRP